MPGASPLRADRGLRLDPTRLPARFSLPAEAGAPAGHAAAIYLGTDGVIVKRRLSGLPLTLSLPLSAYRGVGIRLGSPDQDGLLATIELLHRDPALTLPLGVTADMEAAAFDWQAWADALSLPMLLIDPAGRVEVVGPPGTVVIGTPSPRRRTGLLTKRRPRFLVRRRPGHGGPMPVIRGREIIART